MRLLLLFLASAILQSEVCPYCVREKAKSRVTPGACWVKDPYYDEKGVLHEEKPACDFQCSRGHLYRRLPSGKSEPQGDVPIIPATAVLRQKVPAAPLLTCTINSALFIPLKQSYLECGRGNCAAEPSLDPMITLMRLIEAIECR